MRKKGRISGKIWLYLRMTQRIDSLIMKKSRADKSLFITFTSYGQCDLSVVGFSLNVVFKIECLIHIDLSRSKNPAIA